LDNDFEIQGLFLNFRPSVGWPGFIRHAKANKIIKIDGLIIVTTVIIGFLLEKPP
jgi:hypothetical protein